MATSQNFLNAIAALKMLTAEELNELVPHWKIIAKGQRAVRAQVAVEQHAFKHGDVLSWISTKGRTAGMRFYFKFTKMNRAGTACQGPSCNADGVVGPFSGTCTVAPTFVDMVNGQLITK